jgi:hypothetical protein
MANQGVNKMADGTAATQRCIQSRGKVPEFGNSARRLVRGKLMEYSQDGLSVPPRSKRISSTGKELRSKDEGTRLGAVNWLKEGKRKDALVFIGTYCERADAREAAIEALAGEWDALEKVARYNTSDGSGAKAVERMAKDVAEGPSPGRGAMEAGDGFFSAMERIAKYAGRENVALAVIGQAALSEDRLVGIACNSNHPKVRMAAFEKISRRESIILVMRDSVFADTRNSAIEEVLETNLLEPAALVSAKEKVDAAVKERKSGDTFTEIGNVKFTVGQGKKVIDYLAAKTKAKDEHVSADPQLFDEGISNLVR